MNEEVLLVGLIVMALFAFAAAMAWTARARLFRNAARDRLVSTRVDRFGELPEFVGFVQSREGRALIGAGDAGAAVALRLFGALLAGCALLALGVLLLWMGVPPAPGTDINLVRAAEDYRWWGGVLTALSVGILVAVATAAALARRWRVVGSDA
jgi:Mn2+/Fe2+ NRAMP family transporter